MITLQEVYNKCCEAAKAKWIKVGDLSVPNYTAKFKDLNDSSALTIAEKEVWNGRNFPQVHNVISVLDQSYRENIWARFEYPIPGSKKRCDLILTGMKDNKPVLLVVEFKSWDKFNTSENKTVDAVDNQINNYIKLLENRHEYCHDDNITIKGVGIFTKIKSDAISPNNEQYPHHSIHCKDEEGQDCFIQFLIGTFDCSSTNNIDEETKKKIVLFDSGKFTYKKEDIVKMLTQLPELLPKISKILGSTNSINEFSPDYKKIIEGILSNIVSKEKSFTIVKGEAGSGKTAMAIYILLLHLYRNLYIENKQASCRLVIKSKVLREVLAENMNKYFGNILGESLITHDNGFYKENDTQYDLVIIDEAHSLSSIKIHERDTNYGPQSKGEMEMVLQTIFNKARHLVCFIDEEQSIYSHSFELDNEFLETTWNDLDTNKNDNKANKYELKEQYRLDDDYYKYIKKFYLDFKEKKEVSENVLCVSENARVKFTDDPGKVIKFLNDNTIKHNKLTKILVNLGFKEPKKKVVKLFGNVIMNLKDNEDNIEIVKFMDIESIDNYNNSQYYLNAFSALGFDIDYGVLILRENKFISFDNNYIIFKKPNNVTSAEYYDDYMKQLRYFWVLLTRIKKELVIFIDTRKVITINDK